MPKINHDKFMESLAYNAKFHASRLIDQNDERYLNAAAVLMSVLTVLENHASAKALTHADIRAINCAVFSVLDIEEQTTPMGAITYVRRAGCAVNHTKHASAQIAPLVSRKGRQS